MVTSQDAASDWSPPKGYIPAPSHVEGIAVYSPAPEEEVEQTRTFKCRHCGGVVSYNVAQRGLLCPYCGKAQSVDADQVGRDTDEFEFTLEAMARPQYGWGGERRELVCESCGAVVVVAPTVLTSTCAFCSRFMAKSIEDRPVEATLAKM